MWKGSTPATGTWWPKATAIRPLSSGLQHLFLLGNNGHLSIVEPADYFSLLPSARLYRRSRQTAWADILERKETREKYRSLLALDRAINSSGEEEEPALETPAPLLAA